MQLQLTAIYFLNTYPRLSSVVFMLGQSGYLLVKSKANKYTNGNLFLAIWSVLTSYHKAKDIKYMAVYPVSSKYFWKIYNVPEHLLSFTGQLQNWDCRPVLWLVKKRAESWTFVDHTIMVQKTEIKHQKYFDQILSFQGAIVLALIRRLWE